MQRDGQPGGNAGQAIGVGETWEAASAEGWGNLFAGIAREAADEEFRALLTRPGLRIERIVSTGQVSADWYDQARDEWILIVAGRAHLLIEDEGEMVLGPGDHLLIAAHVRHRVTWTDPDQPTIWLAVHFGGGTEVSG